MKKLTAFSFILCFAVVYLSFSADDTKPVPLPVNKQRPGDAALGYRYLVMGDYLRSGVPYSMFKLGFGRDTSDLLRRDSLNRDIAYQFTALKAPNGELIVAPNCLRCHGQMFEGKLYPGLGNSFEDFSSVSSMAGPMNGLYAMLSAHPSKQFDAAKDFLVATRVISPFIQTDVRGVNSADRLASILAAHRDPVTFKWSDDPLLSIPTEVIPSDVPAWWLLKKKNAMFYNGFGRGDFPKFLMASNLLTVTDTSEAGAVYQHFSDVLAYIYSLEPPKYPGAIDHDLAGKGKKLFGQNCSGCHGTYGEKGKYPNLVIPEDIIGTDSALYSSNYSNPQFVDWFNKSWFTKGDHPAKLVPFRGYIAPPLDGIWITAPYLHNGSVPTLEGVLNSKARPAYWTRDFNKPQYDYTTIGWQYTASDKALKGAYNTTIKGYGNYGHYFGDKLTNEERKSVIEYLKTL